MNSRPNRRICSSDSVWKVAQRPKDSSNFCTVILFKLDMNEPRDLTIIEAKTCVFVWWSIPAASKFYCAIVFILFSQILKFVVFMDCSYKNTPPLTNLNSVVWFQWISHWNSTFWKVRWFDAAHSMQQNLPKTQLPSWFSLRVLIGCVFSA